MQAVAARRVRCGVKNANGRYFVTTVDTRQEQEGPVSDTRPKTYDEALAQILSEPSRQVKATFKAMNQDQLWALHFGLGMDIRSRWL
jgi:hypothetical protein